MRLFSSIFIQFFTILLLTPQSATGSIIQIPEDFVTIQGGIDNAQNGDTILIASGSYRGIGNTNLDVEGKSILIQSQNDPTNCVIDCQENGRAFIFQSRETNSTEIRNLTIKNGLISCLT